MEKGDGTMSRSFPLYEDLLCENERLRMEVVDCRAQLQAVFSLSGLGLAQADPVTSRLLRVNETLCAMLGYTEDELLSKTLLELTHPEDAQRQSDDFRRLARGEISKDRVDLRLIRKDGAIRWAHIHITLVRGADGSPCRAGAVIQDITERKRVEAALRESEERLRLALAAGQAGQMGAWNIDLNIDETPWDAQEFELLGLSEGRPTQERFYESVHPDDRRHIRQAIQRAMKQTGTLDHEFRIVRPDGEVRWLAAKGQVLKDERGRPLRMVGVNFDVTERKRTDDRLRSFTLELEWRVAERTRELQRSQEQLRALATELNLTEQRERKRLASDLHDYLAQLLVLVRLKLGQLKRAPSLAVMTEMAQAAEEAVNEALTYTRTLVAQLSPPVLHEFGLPAALHWLSQQMVRQELSVAVTQLVPDEVPLPEDQAMLLFQSVRELLMNIKKHAGTHDASVTIERANHELWITVRDEGAGIDEAAAAHSAASAQSSKFGLFSIRERMRAIGGRFDLESVMGGGTTARLVVPYNDDEAASGQQSSSAEVFGVHETLLAGGSTLSQESSNAIRVLLVDDHTMVREGLRTLLKEHGDVTVVGEAWDGEEAVAFVDRLRPDVVIMDVNMPRLDGIEATRRIKAAFRSVAVVGMSVNASSQVEEAMRLSGADAFLSKEAAGEQIYQTINAAVKRGGDRVE